VTILEEIISTIAGEETVCEVRACVFWTAVVSRWCGLASTGRDEGWHEGSPVRDAGSLAGRRALDVAALSQSESLREAAIGVAAINSLLEIDRDRCIDLNASEIIVEGGRGKRVVIVGRFPFIGRVREVARELAVLERVEGPGTLPESKAEEVIPDADVVAITGSALVNHSLEKLLGLCPAEALVIVLGPTTPLSTVLFDHGVDVIAGTRVMDTPEVLRFISEGAAFKQVRGVELLTMRKE